MDTKRYWHAEGLIRLVRAPASPIAAPSGGEAIPPSIEDLVRLHRLVRNRMSTTVLEFGVGYSTLVLADALAKNEADYRALPQPPKLRTAAAFQLYSVDANEHWIAEARRRLPAELAPRAHISHSRVEAGTFNGRLCHFYERLPNVVPDFVYLDGPDPTDVEGAVSGLDFSIRERTPMAADLLRIESTLLPRAFILIDGRTNNARFLQRNFQRRFQCKFDRAGDVTTFELDEPPLGRNSVDLAALRAKAARRPRRSGRNRANPTSQAAS